MFADPSGGRWVRVGLRRGPLPGRAVGCGPVRLFVAVVPPSAVVTELAAAVQPLRSRPDAGGLRWVDARGWHLTLAFLGEVPDETRPELEDRLHRAARRHEPHTLWLAGGGTFDHSTLWARVEGDLSALSHLAGSVAAAARRATGGDPAGRRRFHPHLTLARAARGAQVPLRPFADALSAFHGSSWTVGTLHLVASRLPRSGVPGEQPQYTTVAAWPLGRQDPDGGPPAADG